MNSRSILYFLSVFILISCKTHATDIDVINVEYNDDRISYEGRIGENKTKKASEIYWSGSSIKINFEGTVAKTTLEDQKGVNYFNVIIERLEALTGHPLKDHISFVKSYCINDFIKDYNSYKGNAYGLANTLMQTSFLRPRIKSKRVNNLFFTGQLTVPGPGVPPALISGKIAAEAIIKQTNQ